VAAQSLCGSELLLWQHAEHDVRFAQACADPTRTVAALFPCKGALSTAELRDKAARETDGRITLIAVDATWNGARHVAASYPKDLVRVQLSPEELFEGGARTASLLAPLRKYKPHMPEYDNRCTLCSLSHASLDIQAHMCKLSSRSSCPL
jgi:DTW domain